VQATLKYEHHQQAEDIGLGDRGGEIEFSALDLDILVLLSSISTMFSASPRASLDPP
jgi:hypothetical protein